MNNKKMGDRIEEIEELAKKRFIDNSFCVEEHLDDHELKEYNELIKKYLGGELQK